MHTGGHIEVSAQGLSAHEGTNVSETPDMRVKMDSMTIYYDLDEASLETLYSMYGLLIG